MKKTLGIVIAVSTGLIVLAGYFFQSQLGPLLSMILDWGILLAGVLGLIGLGYLIRMHILKIAQYQKGAFNSVIVLAAFLFALIAGFILTPNDPFYQNLILNVQIPIEASLLAILAVALLYASLRLIRTRGWTLMSVAFLASAVLSLILDLGFIQTRSGTLGAELIALLDRLPTAGARGILLGMALGGMVVGLRVLLTVDQPYAE
ncbi:MAG: hypothetical protein SVT56_00615 [Chloroflexota bacterium]|jgi:hypothetical protein|nr:hypothetical protein [Chloroflexota bacterium]